MTKGRRYLPWIKLWFDMLGDPKMTRLSSAEKWYWIGILLLAGQSPIRGKLMLTDVEPMSIEDMAKALHLPPEEFPSFENTISSLISLKSLRWNEHSLEVIHFKNRQEVYPSDFKTFSEITPDKLLIDSEITPKKVLKEADADADTDTDTPKGARKKRADPTVNEIMAEMKSYLGYPSTVDKDPIPSYGKEGQAIKRMLARGFTREEILACWTSKVSQCGGEVVSMTWVNEDIGRRSGSVRSPKGVRPKPDQGRVHPIRRIPGD